ncbi:MAG: insulinase family protein [Firmicutes bacterium]|nr:insulinase family protein [Bacillota bacterium]MBR3705839.1 insulinase family protein [Bacillota bacterium]
MGNISIRKLDCGVRVIMEKIDHVKSAAFGVWVKAGAIYETPANAGVSHFIEHMMFKGTETRNARQIAEDIDKIGGQINAFTGKEATCYYVKTIGTNLEKGAEVILDMLNNSVFDKHEMTKERKVICEEIKMIEDQPDDLAHDTVTELLFKGNPLGKSIIGTPTSLRGISRNVMVEYKEREYTRDSVVVSVAGNFDEDAFCAYLEDKFTGLGASKTVEKAELVPYRPSFRTIVKDIQQSHICLAAKGLALDDERYYSMSLLNNIMGGSMSSRLFQNIREEKGLAYSVFSMASSFSNDGYFNIYAGVGHDKIKDAMGGILEELDILDREGVTEEELSMAKEQMKANYIFGQENVASRMFANGKNLALLDRIFTAEEVIEGIDSVTMEDIDNIKKLICDPALYTGVAVTDKRVDLKKFWK